MQSKEALPILYSFRRCPYAIRARYAIYYRSKIVYLREVKLQNKPDELFEFTKKGTVPILLLNKTSQVISESLDIMFWAFGGDLCDSNKSWKNLVSKESENLILTNDNFFKYWLDRYKYFDRFPQKNKEFYRLKCEQFIEIIEQKLKNRNFIVSNEVSFVDIAIFPFVRQFALFDINWFKNSKYQKTGAWLNQFLEQCDFKEQVMKKFTLWKEFHQEYLFPQSI